MTAKKLATLLFVLIICLGSMTLNAQSAQEVQIVGNLQVTSELGDTICYLQDDAGVKYYVESLKNLPPEVIEFVKLNKKVVITGTVFNESMAPGYRLISPSGISLYDSNAQVQPNPQNVEESSLQSPLISFIKQYKSHILAGFIVIIFVGIVCAWRGVAVVYNDFNDLLLNFVVCILPAAFWFLYVLMDKSVIFIYLGVAIEAVLILYISYTTFVNNNGILPATIALFTKIPLGFIYAFAVVTLIMNHGDYSKKGRQSRNGAKIVLLILTPIMTLLVRDKSGVFNVFETAKVGTGRIVR